MAKSEKDPIRLGHTTIDHAIDILVPHVAGRQSDAGFLTPSRSLTAEQARAALVRESKDGRRSAVGYSRRSGYLFWPICGYVQVLHEPTDLVPDVDRNGIVTDYHTTGDPQRYYVNLDRPVFGQSLQPNRPDGTQPATWPATTRSGDH